MLHYIRTYIHMYIHTHIPMYIRTYLHIYVLTPIHTFLLLVKIIIIVLFFVTKMTNL